MHMELTINCIVHFCSFLLSFFFFWYMKELGQHFPELPNLLYTYKKGKAFLLPPLSGGKQYNMYKNFLIWDFRKGNLVEKPSTVWNNTGFYVKYQYRHLPLELIKQHRSIRWATHQRKMKNILCLWVSQPSFDSRSMQKNLDSVWHLMYPLKDPSASFSPITFYISPL